MKSFKDAHHLTKIGIEGMGMGEEGERWKRREGGIGEEGEGWESGRGRG